MKPILAIIGCAILAAASAASRCEDGGVAVMIANDSDDWIRLSCVCPGVVSECRITDADRTDEAVAMPSEMPPRSFLVAISK